MNIDRLSLEKGNNLYDVEYPMVVIKDRDISRELKGFLGRRFGIEKIFGQILTQFGFTKDDMIVLKNIDYNQMMNVVTFEYSVNLVNDSNNKIMLDFNCWKELIICDRSMSVSCDCSTTSLSDISVRIKKIVEKLNRYKIYTRRYGYSDSEYSIMIGSKEIRLNLRKDNDNDYRELMSIDDDDKLEEYFKNCDGNVSIDELYKDIVGYLGDIHSYNEVKLEISKIRNNKKINTDLLVLRNGVCQEFMTTRNNRCIYLNNNGEWSYNHIDRFYKVSALGRKDSDVTYSVSADNDSILKYYMDSVEDVVDEVEDTKKLVRSIFNKDMK